MFTSAEDQKQKVIVLAGPTAIGKTELSLAVAEEFGCEIISMDSMQIYKYMDIGTAKPTVAERRRVPHHLVDFVEPAELYNVGCYVSDARRVIKEVAGRSRLPMLVGGTGMYMTRLLDGIFELPDVPQKVRNQVQNLLQEKGHAYLHAELEKVDPQSAARIHHNDSQRLTRAMEIWQATGVPWSRHLQIEQEERAKQRAGYEVLKIGLNRDRTELYARINKRVEIMVEQGILPEVENLLAMGYSRELNPMQSIGYKHMVNYIDKIWQWDESLAYLARDTRRYAKRQLTWFGRDEEINWFRPDDIEAVRRILSKFVRH
ncbi:MAG: tRNA (adenosine(37)-N6)-dimethylallyltransferase MiaA [Proteobacteria bacterium]|nr:tRNA (adenosine(37)-N6)-dimethylallyltransferase MiaA [Pseudomonadota bacterium]MBU4298280.1 tRNA (adenosine(37)-N6)-dimethylallyltransferase MiaA [Pseudomonadota bacterium]MCG2747547.1 tRNA (adenosine(37)-N6)-dimethylallyltransferase MiaA [Desulfobulbaceae bacterium]